VSSTSSPHGGRPWKRDPGGTISTGGSSNRHGLSGCRPIGWRRATASAAPPSIDRKPPCWQSRTAPGPVSERCDAAACSRRRRRRGRVPPGDAARVSGTWKARCACSAWCRRPTAAQRSSMAGAAPAGATSPPRPRAASQWFAPRTSSRRVALRCCGTPRRCSALAVAARSELVPEWSPRRWSVIPRPSAVHRRDQPAHLERAAVPTLPAKTLDVARPAADQFINGLLSTLEFQLRACSRSRRNPATPAPRPAPFPRDPLHQPRSVLHGRSRLPEAPGWRRGCTSAPRTA